LSLPFVRNSADTSSATSGTAFPCFSRILHKEWVNSCWEKWHEQRTDAQRISHVWETSHLNATSKSQASNKQDPFSLLSTNLVRQQ
jgi:hypothetical protein